MADPIDQQLIASVSQRIVGQLADDELPLFAVNSQAYFKNPKKALESNQQANDALGFGLEAAVPFLTPIVLSVVTEVVKSLMQALSQHLAQKTETSIATLFKHSDPASGPAPQVQLSAAQLAEVRSVAFAKARQLKLPEPQAALLADSVIGSLAVTPVS